MVVKPISSQHKENPMAINTKNTVKWIGAAALSTALIASACFVGCAPQENTSAGTQATTIEAKKATTASLTIKAPIDTWTKATDTPLVVKIVGKDADGKAYEKETTIDPTADGTTVKDIPFGDCTITPVSTPVLANGTVYTLPAEQKATVTEEGAKLTFKLEPIADDALAQAVVDSNTKAIAENKDLSQEKKDALAKAIQDRFAAIAAAKAQAEAQANAVAEATVQENNSYADNSNAPVVNNQEAAGGYYSGSGNAGGEAASGGESSGGGNAGYEPWTPPAQTPMSCFYVCDGCGVLYVATPTDHGASASILDAHMREHIAQGEGGSTRWYEGK